MRFAAKGAKFDPDDIKTFREIYTHVKDYCIMIRDMEDLVQEQGMGELPSGFRNRNGSLKLKRSKDSDREEYFPNHSSG